MSLPLDQSDYDTFGVDLDTRLLFDHHGSVCGCPQFWGLSTDYQNAEPDLSSGCPYPGRPCHHPHAPSRANVAREVATGATPSTPTHISRPHAMSTAEPSAAPSRVFKETCIFWYHGNCGRGADCHYEHELNHNWPISRPPGYTHHRRCDLKFCPLRTDMVEFMQRYYPGGSRADEIAEKADVKHEEKEHTSMTLDDEAVDSDSDETSEDESSTDSDSDSDNSEAGDDDSEDASVAESVSARRSDTVKVEPPSVCVTQRASSQVLNQAVPLLLHTNDGVPGEHKNENYELGQTITQDDKKKLNAGSVVTFRKQGKATRAERPAAFETRRAEQETAINSAPFLLQPSNEAVAMSRSSPTPPPPGTPGGSLPPTSISHAGKQKRKQRSSQRCLWRYVLRPATQQNARVHEEHLAPNPRAAPLTTPTSISHAGTHGRKRKLYYNDDIHVTMHPSKKQRLPRRAGKAEQSLAVQKHNLPPIPEAVPLIDRITYDRSVAPTMTPSGSAHLPNISAHHARVQAPQIPLADRITYLPKEPQMVLSGPKSCQII